MSSLIYKEPVARTTDQPTALIEKLVHGSVLTHLSQPSRMALASRIAIRESFIFSSTFLRADVTGSISGVVRDSSQAVVGAARVQATNAQTTSARRLLPAQTAHFTCSRCQSELIV